jgi:hypothetical protein
MNKLTVAILAVLIIFTSLVLADSVSSNRDVEDTKLSGMVLVLQSAWFSDPSELTPLGVSNNGIAVNGSAVLQDQGGDLSTYLAYTEAQITASFGSYVTKHNLNGSSAYVIMDLEAVVAPKNWGEYYDADDDDSSDDNDDSSQFNQIVEAFKLRISVARTLLPDAKICLYGVPVPTNWLSTSSTWIQQTSGLTEAAELGAFDQADYLVPVLYTRYCEEDASSYQTRNEEVIDVALGAVDSFTRSNGEQIPVMPLITPTLFNGASDCNKTNLPASELWSQITQINGYPIDGYFIWVGNEDMPDTDQTIPEYLTSLLKVANQNSSGF